MQIDQRAAMALLPLFTGLLLSPPTAGADPSSTTWTETATKLGAMHLHSGRHDLGQRRAERPPAPETILPTLLSTRGSFLALLLRAGAIIHESQPGDETMSHVNTGMQRLDFPKYVRALYVLGADGPVQRDVYGSGANTPGTSLPKEVSEAVSLLPAPSNLDRAWLVDPVGSRFLAVGVGVASTPEENVRLGSIQKNVGSDAQWRKLYQLGDTETCPAGGSAIGALLGGAVLAGDGPGNNDEISDNSSVLSYYCVQNESGDVVQSDVFAPSRLGYGGTGENAPPILPPAAAAPSSTRTTRCAKWSGRTS
ncbi:MAG: hypothetical protein ABEL97_00985 [Salinibacter sp.]